MDRRLPLYLWHDRHPEKLDDRLPHGEYSNLWVIRFAPSGQAIEFTEWWMDHASPS